MNYFKQIHVIPEREKISNLKNLDQKWAERCSIKECIPGWHNAKTISQLEQMNRKEMEAVSG